MNVWQVCRQLRYLLRAAVWPDGSGAPVFGTSVYVSAGVAADQATRCRFPLALIAPAGAQVDEDQADLHEATIRVTVAAQVAGDWTGEHALIGAARSGGVGASGGRGVLELEEVVRDVVGYVDGQEGIRLQVVAASEAAAAPLGSDQSAVTLDLTLECWCRVARSYAPAYDLQATVNGTVDLVWTPPAGRYDLLGLVLRRASGTTAPASPADGTSVTLPSGVPSSVSDNPGAGTWTYALFAAYDEVGGGTADRYSPAVTATVTV